MHPVLALNNIEFICLKMFANPGRPARWYLRALRQYRFGKPGTGSWNALYLAPSGRYRGVLFNDAAPKVRDAKGIRCRTCSAKGQFHLTNAGIAVAQKAAAKIGAA